MSAADVIYEFWIAAGDAATLGAAASALAFLWGFLKGLEPRASRR